MLFQDICAKVIALFSKDRVNMVAIVAESNIVVFNQKVRTVQDIVMGLVVLQTSDPSEVYFFNP